MYLGNVCAQFFIFLLPALCFLPHWDSKNIRWEEETRDMVTGYRLTQHLPASCAHVYTWPRPPRGTPTPSPPPVLVLAVIITPATSPRPKASGVLQCKPTTKLARQNVSFKWFKVITGHCEMFVGQESGKKRQDLCGNGTVFLVRWQEKGCFRLSVKCITTPIGPLTYRPAAITAPKPHKHQRCIMCFCFSKTYTIAFAGTKKKDSSASKWSHSEKVFTLTRARGSLGLTDY